MPDKYGSFRELVSGELPDAFEITECYGAMRHVSIIAPHGGKIEPGTSQIARSISGDLFNLYCFDGRKPRYNDHLHITSTKFDEPTAIRMASTDSSSVAGKNAVMSCSTGRCVRMDVPRSPCNSCPM